MGEHNNSDICLNGVSAFFCRSKYQKVLITTAITTQIMAKSDSDDNDNSDVESPKELIRKDVEMKYYNAAEITNKVLQVVITACIDGADIYTICRTGDTLIDEMVSTIHNKKVNGKVVTKGVGFPTCISVNEFCGHVSPLKQESSTLKKYDVCKIDLGCHIDGFIAVVAHTIIIPDSEGKLSIKPEPTTEPILSITPEPSSYDKCYDCRADVVMAAWTAAEAAVRLVKEGNTNDQVTDIITLAAEQFKCSPLRGVLSHQLKQHVIDGNQVIIGKENTDEQVDSFTFQVNEAYAIDIIMSTGDGKPKESDLRITVFKRDVEQSYNLKTQLGRKFLHEVKYRMSTLPFSLSTFEDETMARVGVAECMRHSLLLPYPIITEKPGEYTAQFKYTVLLLPGGTKKITGLPFLQRQSIESKHSITDKGLLELLATPIQIIKMKKPKQKKAVDTVSSDATGAVDEKKLENKKTKKKTQEVKENDSSAKTVVPV